MDPQEFNRIFKTVARVKPKVAGAIFDSNPKIILLPKPCEDCGEMVEGRHLSIYPAKRDPGWIRNCNQCNRKRVISHPLGE